MFYAKSTGGFYTKEIHGDNIPKDAVKITVDEYNLLMDGQAEGKQIIGNDSGVPVLTKAIEIEHTYAEKRAYEYPSIQEYLDGVVKGDQSQINNYIAKCLAVKAKYPKQ